MSSKLKNCKTCNNEIAKSAKVCPSCGAKLKMGFFTKGLIGLIGLIIIGVALAPSSEDIKLKLDTLASSQASELSSTGDLKDIFSFGSDYTDLQRDSKEKEILGSIVEWSLPVYEVTKSNDSYIIQTQTALESVVGTFIYLTPRNETDKNFIESVKTGELISFKGEISDVRMRMLVIKPAVLIQNHETIFTESMRKEAKENELENQTIESEEISTQINESTKNILVEPNSNIEQNKLYSSDSVFDKSCKEMAMSHQAPAISALREEAKRIELVGSEGEILKHKELQKQFMNVFTKQSEMSCGCIKNEAESILRSMNVSRNEITEIIENFGLGIKLGSSSYTDKRLVPFIYDITNECSQKSMNYLDEALEKIED